MRAVVVYCQDSSVRNTFLIYTSFGAPLERLALQSAEVPRLEAGRMRVAMSLAPVNPSDLIPITGAYAHRISLPAVAGYEGVGRVVDAPATHTGLLGQRVLPLRGPGTWQAYVDCDPLLAIPVPEWIPDLVAARAYINPLAAAMMLERWPVAGKRVLLSGAGSACAELLGHWARQEGAAVVQGIYRSECRKSRLLAQGIEPIAIDDIRRIEDAAMQADLCFDSLGGPVGSAVLESMGAGTTFIGYGLLSGQSLRSSGSLRVTYRRFHLRDALEHMTADAWQSRFSRCWQTLPCLDLPPVEVFQLADWRDALALATRPGGRKPVLCFD